MVLLVLALGGIARAHGDRPHLAKPRPGAQIVVGPVAVPSGSEVTECTYMKFPSKHDMAVNRVDIKVRGGSHHIHLYRPYDHTLDLANGHETCNFALNFDVWQLILASQSVRLRWKLPPGIAFFFHGGEQLVAQTHYVDNGLLSSPPDGCRTEAIARPLTAEDARSRRLRPSPAARRRSGCRLQRRRETPTL